MKNLYICETPFQIIAALLTVYNIENSNIKEGVDICDFIITNSMTNAEKILQDMQKQRTIHGVYLVKVKKDKSAFKRRLLYVLDEVLAFDKRWNYKPTIDCYDNMYVRNFTEPIAKSAYSYFKKKNKNMKLYVYDEGYSSYTSEFWNSHQRISFLHKVCDVIGWGLGKLDILKGINRAIFFDTSLFHVKIPYEIGKMIDDDFQLTEYQRHELNSIFGYSQNDLELSGKYIFFEECFSSDNNNFNDIEIIRDIEKIVGKENILIKLHPRSTKDRFSELGYSVLDITYPWEIFAINNASSNITLISISSGSLMNYLFFTKTKMRSILLYEIYADKYVHIQNDEVRKWFSEVVRANSEIIFVPKSKLELQEHLKEIKYES